MSEITNITIRNIKGFLNNDNSFDVHILPNKVNLLVAPNGFGKSSIAKGFEYLNSNRLNLPNDYYHDQFSPILPELSIKYNGNTLVANKDTNDINLYFDVTVINSGLKATSKIKHAQQRIIHQGVLEVEDIVLRTSIPKLAHIEYTFTKIKNSFGQNKKILTNLTDFFKISGIADIIHGVYDYLDFLNKGDSKKIIKKVIEYLNSLSGSAEKIIEKIDNKMFDELEAINEYHLLQDEIKKIKMCNSPFSRFELYFQINWLYKHCRQNLLNTRRYDNYIILRDRYNSIIRSVDTTGRKLQAHEEGGKLIVTFPLANTISNGQRDILIFIINLVKFQMNYNEDKNHLLIIDEVFDYLDDANIVAAQYFLSKFLSINKEKFFLVIFSHLSEEHFRGWVLKKKINTQYIKPIQAKANKNTKAFIAYRDFLKKVDNDNYSKLSNYYFHYNPNTKEQNLIAAYQNKDGLKPNWFKGINLHNYIIVELNKYLSAEEQYDPYAVCFALRFACEKNIYYQLKTDEERKIFLEEKHKTKHKLEWAEQKGLEVPIIYYMLSIIFNEAEHINGYEIEKNKERSCVYKLDNGVIRQMAIDLFNYQGKDLDVSVLL